MTQVNIAKDFSEFPAGRFVADGPHSGQRFRDDVLAPALRRGERLVILMDGTMGYGSSFLEEAFGGLVRSCGFTPEQLRTQMQIKTSDSSLEAEVWEYVDGAKPTDSAE